MTRDYCVCCGGLGEVEETREVRASEATGGMSEESRWVRCWRCQGSGIEPDAETLERREGAEA